MHKHSLIWVLIFGVIALMFLHLPQMAAKQDAVLNTYSSLVEVDALAKQKFVEPIEGNRLVDGAIRGMLLQLDPYSGYIAPGELPAFERRASGDYIGVGIVVGVRNEKLTVIAPIEGSPAAKAGALPGDVILSIDGRDTEGLSVFDVEELLLGGLPGTTLRLRVSHEGDEEPECLTIARGPVNMRTVRGFRRNASTGWNYMIDPANRIGYIRVSNFLHNTMRDFDAAIRDLKSQGLRGLIIDLRFNPGGLMHQAVAMVDRFADGGIILSTVTRRKAVRQYLATQRMTLTDVKLAVLVNAASASAAEIVAGSLQACDRALIVGERSFGKGSVQHLIYLTESKGAVKLTTAYYRLPDGRIIHRTKKNAQTDSWGVIPDINFALSDEEKHAIQESRRALDSAFTESASVSNGSDTSCQRPGESGVSELLRDRQLLEALSRLRERIDNTRTATRRSQAIVAPRSGP